MSPHRFVLVTMLNEKFLVRDQLCTMKVEVGEGMPRPSG